MGEEHRILLGPEDLDPDGSPEKRDVVHSVLEKFWNGWVLKDSTYQRPSTSFILRSSPIVSIRLPRVIERNNECKVSSGSEANACDSRPSRFNVRTKERAACDVVMDEGPYVGKGGLDPDGYRRSPEFWELSLAVGFVEVDDGDGAEFVLADHGCRVIHTEQLVVTNTMGAEKSSTPEFTDTSPASESPNRSVAHSNDKIGIMGNNLVPKAIQFAGVFMMYPSYVAEFRISRDGLAAISAEVFQPIPRWVEIEHVGSVELRVRAPDFFKVLRVAFGVVCPEPSPITL